MLIFEVLVFAVEFPEIHGEVFEDDIEFVEIVDVGWREDVVDFNDFGMFHPSEYGEFPESSEGENTVAKDLAILFDGVDLSGLAMLDFIDFSICSAAEDLEIDEAFIEDVGTHIFDWLHC